MAKSHEMDMTDGPILKKIIMFSLPLMFSGILQLLFNAADIIVVGKFAGSLSLAAVGSTTSLISLMVNIFIGISTGTNVLAAKFFGSRSHQDLSRCVHTSIALSAVMGIVVCFIGIFLSEPMLWLMKSDPEVLPLSALYLKIYFLGIPATVIYNFCAAILRAIGDTDRPLRYLLISGVVNVVLNLVLVIMFHMDVAGVAIATAVSQYVSAFLVLRCMMKSDAPHHLEWKQICFDRKYLVRIFMIGVPAGLQSTMFSISNVTIQSAVNTLGPVTMASTSAANNLNSFIYISMNSLYHAALSFTSQNIGAGKKERVKRILLYCAVSVAVVGLVLGNLVYGFGPQLLSLYISSTDPQRDQVLSIGMQVLGYWARPYFIFGLMEVAAGVMRGLGKSWTPLLITGTGICLLRVVWVFTIFAMYPTPEMLYLSYPVSWIVTTTAQYAFLLPIMWKLYHKQPTKSEI